MKQFHDENINPSEIEECAGLILDTVPRIMKIIRSERREFGLPELPLAHFRVLANLSHHPESSLSDLAEEIGLTLPSLSKIVDALFENGLVYRKESENDRRFLRLSLTEEGVKVLNAARLETQRRLAKRLENLSREERAVIIEGLRSLKDIFALRKNNGMENNEE